MPSNRQIVGLSDCFTIDRDDIAAWSKRESKPRSAATVRGYIVSLTRRKFREHIRDCSQKSPPPLNKDDLNTWCTKEGISIVKRRSVQWANAMAFYARYLEYMNARDKQATKGQYASLLHKRIGSGTVGDVHCRSESMQPVLAHDARNKQVMKGQYAPLAHKRIGSSTVGSACFDPESIHPVVAQDRFIIDCDAIVAWSQGRSKPRSAAIVKSHIVCLTGKQIYRMILDYSQISTSPMNKNDLATWCTKEGISIVKERSVKWSRALAFYAKYLEHAHGKNLQPKKTQTVRPTGESIGSGGAKNTSLGPESKHFVDVPSRFVVDCDDIIAWWKLIKTSVSRPRTLAGVKTCIAALTGKPLRLAIRFYSRISPPPLNNDDLATWCTKEGISFVRSRSVRWARCLAFYAKYLEYVKVRDAPTTDIQFILLSGESIGCCTVKSTCLGRELVEIARRFRRDGVVSLFHGFTKISEDKMLTFPNSEATLQIAVTPISLEYKEQVKRYVLQRRGVPGNDWQVWDSVTELTIRYPLYNVPFPRNLQHLRYEYHGVTPMTTFILPGTLVSVDFCFNARFKCDWPENLKELTFGPTFNQQLPSCLPASLRSITFGHDFDQDVKDVVWPENLEKIVFGSDFNQKLPNLPANVRSIEFGSGFDKGIEDVAWPAKLESLSFGAGFRSKIHNLPATIRCIKFVNAPQHPCYECIENTELPKALESLEFHLNCKYIECIPSKLPANLPASLRRVNYVIFSDTLQESHAFEIAMAKKFTEEDKWTFRSSFIGQSSVFVLERATGEVAVRAEGISNALANKQAIGCEAGVKKRRLACAADVAVNN